MGSRVGSELNRARSLASLSGVEISCLNGGNDVATLLGNVGSLPGRREGAFNTRMGGLGTRTTRLVRRELTRLGRGRVRHRVTLVPRFSVASPITLTENSCRPVALIRERYRGVFSSVKFGVRSCSRVMASCRYFRTLGVPGRRPTESVRSACCLSGNRLLGSRASTTRGTVLGGCNGKLVRGNAPVGTVFPNEYFEGRTASTYRRGAFFRVRNIVISGSVSVSGLVCFVGAVLSRMFGGSVGIELHPNFFPFIRPNFRLSVDYLVYNNRNYPSYGRDN